MITFSNVKSSNLKETRTKVVHKNVSQDNHNINQIYLSKNHVFIHLNHNTFSHFSQNFQSNH
jgi:hypothetical protein